MPTIHNQAPAGSIAPAVLMPGDPLRADYIAHRYLKDAELLSRVRGIPVYTGLFRGVKVSVMASGMGAGSMGIYSHELFHDYNVQRILRVGTAGGLSPRLQLRDLVLALSCSTDSGFAESYEHIFSVRIFAPDEQLVKNLVCFIDPAVSVTVVFYEIRKTVSAQGTEQFAAVVDDTIPVFVEREKTAARSKL